MSGDAHVRFCESPGVRFPRATRPMLTLMERVRKGLLITRRGAGRVTIDLFDDSEKKKKRRVDPRSLPLCGARPCAVAKWARS